MKLKIYGESDDSVYVQEMGKEDGWGAQFYFSGNDHDYLTFSDGTALQLHYTDEGFWKITLWRYGTSKYNYQPATDEEKDYSDVVTLDGDFQWVTFGDMSIIPKRGETR